MTRDYQLNEAQISELRSLHFWRRNLYVASIHQDFIECTKSKKAIFHVFKSCTSWIFPSQFKIELFMQHHKIQPLVTYRLVDDHYSQADFTLVIVDSDEWKSRIETVHKGEIEKFQRYRFEKNPRHLDRTHLLKLLSTLPEGYEIKKVDRSIVKAPTFHELSEDFVSQFDSIDDFINRGVGMLSYMKEKLFQRQHLLVYMTVV